ncbi:hypothetical protein EDD27_3996 [Nonomuraea polychroma]|uniref:Uncharacterized protein n=1 Tax=Nonomuraea polychroma TaxID=46176 RepID=A0A438M6Y6_9ACTN|nr:hypothetical protein [Nonomuraea polychroma]RVX41457.1 hypothetical protein EDD27_3996 [Nonomuraea polychroma]
MRDTLPPLLVTPPWEQKAPLVPGLRPPTERVVDWEPGEREEWQQRLPGRPHFTAALREIHRLEGWAGVVRAFLDGQITHEPALFSLFELGPEKLVRPLLADWHPTLSRTSDFSILRAVAVRFGADAHHVVFPNAKAHRSGWALMPFLDVEVARLMAAWLGMASARRQAGEWFARHGLAAVPYLVPDALDARRTLRDKAAAALLQIASRYGEAGVVETARRYGAHAACAVARILDGDAGADRPRRVSWLDLDLLPEVCLRDGRALSSDAVKNLIGALTLSPGVRWNGPAEIYPGLEDALDHCDHASLAAFGWAVFEAWESAGMPSGNRWVIDQLIWLGDDEVAGRLGALAVNSPVSMAKHITGVLGDIGTDAALAQLDRVAQQAKPGLRRTAEERLAWAIKRRPRRELTTP